MAETSIKVELEDTGPVKRKLTIEVPSAQVDREFDLVYRSLGKKAKVKGFRPGKVPRSVLELYYRKQVEDEVAENLVRRSLGEALKEKALEPVGVNWPEPAPRVVEGRDYTYRVELEIPPNFAVENYLGLPLEAEEVEAAEAEVDARLEEIRQMNAVLRSPEEPREVREGDFVVLDYQGYFGGQELKEAKEENKYLQVGSGRFHPEFERHLMGLSPGGEARFTVSFAPDFVNPLWAGKVLDFQVKIHEVKEKIAPDLDDAFAQALGGNFQTLADLRAAVQEDIIKEKELARKAKLETQVLDKLTGQTPFELPEALVRQEQENIWRDQFQSLQQQGINVSGLDQNRMLEAMRPSAERRARAKLILERIATQESVAVDDAEVDAALARIAAHSGRDFAQVRQFYQENQLLETLRRQLRDEKTLKLLVDQAEIKAPETPALEEQA
jgi:trigger factor